MAKSVKTKQQIDAIIKVLSPRVAGASIEEIRTAPGLEIEIRTLQRRLAELIELGYVRSTGDKRSTRYHYILQDTVGSWVEEPQERYHTLSLSEKSQEIISHITLPLQRRKPIGYNREFLEQYKPNVDSYLTLQEKQKLAEIGKTTREDQPAGTYAKEILSRLLIDLSWNSSRLEGNTYSLLDTELLIKQGHIADNRSVPEAQMILNHKDAIEFLVRNPDDMQFDRHTILNLHGLLSFQLLPTRKASGRIRSHAVGISGSVFTPLDMPQLIEEMFDLLLKKVSKIENPFEQAFFIMVHLPYLQPFEDVNKRVSRLAANIPFYRQNLSPISFIDVPKEYYTQGLLGIYELNRIDLMKEVFLWAYERSSYQYSAIRQTVGTPDPFVLKYRKQIASLITEVISKGADRPTAMALINDKMLQLQPEDREKFVYIVETELMSLHEGNYARYFVSFTEFKKWKEAWDI
jgi:Fic family protein